MKINYQKSLKFLLWTFLSLLILLIVLIVAASIWLRWGYYDELNQIKKELDSIPGVTVVNIWGHDDMTIEEISARILIKNKGEIVLNNLNKNDNRYPYSVYITECGGYTFNSFSCACHMGSIGIGPSINIGTQTYFGRLLGLKFENVRNVIDHYDQIFRMIDSLARVSNPAHIKPEDKEINMRTTEQFILFERKASKDQDPIFNLLSLEGNYEAAQKLPWVCDSCCVKK